ncbi:hypothetical protein, partial [Acidovorax sp. SUPP1855]|uniref:hypothetical protein n=1 Tax=Acidovorax sp. SUPP1855 TaxID=431774 RepID=UPI0024E111AF
LCWREASANRSNFRALRGVIMAKDGARVLDQQGTGWVLRGSPLSRRPVHIPSVPTIHLLNGEHQLADQLCTNNFIFRLIGQPKLFLIRIEKQNATIASGNFVGQFIRPIKYFENRYASTAALEILNQCEMRVGFTESM